MPTGRIRFLIGFVTLISCSGGSIPEPVATKFGLDQRPQNTSCVARDRPLPTASGSQGVTLVRQWPGLTFTQPIYLTQAPGDRSKWYVVQQGGKVRVFPSTATADTDVKDFVSVAVNTSYYEAGLLGFAFDPGWQTNHQAYLSYTRNVASGDPVPPASCPNPVRPFTSVIARYQSSNGGATLNQGPDEILTIGQPSVYHNGGNIQFGNDGKLYVGFGDGGPGNDPCDSGQDKNSLFGKILRIDVTSAAAGTYKTPPDNPFFGVANAKPEIWALGFRNPWRWSFDNATGDLWLGDVGQNAWEEIDQVVKGNNYGWKICEGKHRRGSTTELCATPGLTDPVVEHGRAEANAITGGYVYRGSAIPSLFGAYIYGDYIKGTIWALTSDATGKRVTKPILQAVPNSLVSFGQGNDGELYVVQISGEIFKLVPTGTPVDDPFPKLLSQTGCVDAADATKPASGVLPYEVNSPLWSDGATKERFFAIPDGTTIAIGSDGDWDLPIGSVTMKHFSVGDKRIETRLFMRHTDGEWAGYSYEWNDAGTDATLLPGAKTKPLDSGAMWTYPSRAQCLACHSQGAGRTLGLENAQLNRDAVYTTTARVSNQLTTLDHIGMFTVPLDPDESHWPHLVDPAGADPVDARARSYLHANCSHCHRPMGGGGGAIDLRFSQNFIDTNTCDQDSMRGPVGTASKILVPSDPTSSILALRLHATDDKRMPPLAVSIPDPTGAVIDEWITSITACP